MTIRTFRQNLKRSFFALLLVLDAGVSLVAAERTLKLAVNPWTGSAVDANVAKILLEENLGYTVELVEVDEFAQFPALASGELDATLEVWPSGHAEDYATYIQQQKTVEDLGPLGVVGKIGWYVPTYLVQQNPALATWEGIKANTALFQTAATGTKGQLLEGDPTWVYRDAEIIAALDLNLQIVQTGSEQSLLAAVEAAYTNQQPVLFYFWTPHSIHSQYELTEVQLPPHTEGCNGCDYPSEVLYKAARSGLRAVAPDAYQFLKHMHYPKEEQIEMIAEVELHGKTPAQAAQIWVDTHPSLWAEWFVWHVEPQTYVGIVLNATNGTALEIQTATTLGTPTAWQTLTNLTLTSSPELFVDLGSLAAGQRFYRTTNEEALRAATVNGWTNHAPPGSEHRIEFAENFSAETNWQTLTNLTLTTSPQVFLDYASTNQVKRIYRTTLVP